MADPAVFQVKSRLKFDVGELRNHSSICLLGRFSWLISIHIERLGVVVLEELLGRLTRQHSISNDAVGHPHSIGVPALRTVGAFRGFMLLLCVVYSIDLVECWLAVGIQGTVVRRVGVTDAE